MILTTSRFAELSPSLSYYSDLTMHHVETIRNCADLLRKGIANRITSATTMNAHSSRSHAIFTVWMKVTFTRMLRERDLLNWCLYLLIWKAKIALLIQSLSYFYSLDEGEF